MADTASIIAGSLPDGRPVLIAAKWVESDGQRIQQLYLNFKENPSPEASGDPWAGWVPVEYLGCGDPEIYPYPTELGTITSGAPGVPMSIFIIDSASGRVYAGSASEDENNPTPDNGPSGISWQGWTDFYTPSGDPRFDASVFQAAASLAVALNDGTLQLYVGSDQGDPQWQMVIQSPPLGSDPVPFFPQAAEQQAASLGRLIAATRPDGRIQIWGVGGEGPTIWTSIQITAGDVSSGWGDWTSFWPAGSEPFLAAGFGNVNFSGGNNAVAALSEGGRLQVWAASTTYEGFGPVYSCWQVSTDSGMQWSPWTADWNINGRAYLVTLAATQLTDNRLQLWGLDVEGNIWTTWKVDTDPNSNWTPLSVFELP
jgi:hypothetical protein